MAGIHTHELTVSAEAIDANGHVNNLEYLRWMQDIAVAHSAARGWDMARYLAVGGTWVVRAHTIEYLGAAFEGDTLSLYTWVGDLGSSSSRRRYLVWRAADECLIARAETLWVYVDMRSGRARRIPDELRASFVVLPSTDAVMEELGLRVRVDGRGMS
jgi:acyl-CoA thioester hydrolase